MCHDWQLPLQTDVTTGSSCLSKLQHTIIFALSCNNYTCQSTKTGILSTNMIWPFTTNHQEVQLLQKQITITDKRHIHSFMITHYMLYKYYVQDILVVLLQFGNFCSRSVSVGFWEKTSVSDLDTTVRMICRILDIYTTIIRLNIPI